MSLNFDQLQLQLCNRRQRIFMSDMLYLMTSIVVVYPETMHVFYTEICTPYPRKGMYTRFKTLVIRENDLMMYLELHFLLVRAHNSNCRTLSVKIMFPQEIIGNIAFTFML